MKLSKMTGTIRGGNCEGAEVAQAKSSVDAVDFLVQQNRPAQAFDDYEKKIWPKIKSVLKPCVGVYALAPRFWHRRCLNR